MRFEPAALRPGWPARGSSRASWSPPAAHALPTRARPAFEVPSVAPPPR
ncbi:hypothetical protein [Micromonospora musae]